MKGLEALKDIERVVDEYVKDIGINEMTYNRIEIIEKELKALKVFIGCNLIELTKLDNGNYFIVRKFDHYLIAQISKETYDLLKEVLKNE